MQPSSRVMDAAFFRTEEHSADYRWLAVPATLDHFLTSGFRVPSSHCASCVRSFSLATHAAAVTSQDSCPDSTRIVPHKLRIAVPALSEVAGLERARFGISAF